MTLRGKEELESLIEKTVIKNFVATTSLEKLRNQKISVEELFELHNALKQEIS